jgi:O-antigen/teichoic acid export membrane protein
MSKIKRDIVWTMLAQGSVAGALFLQYWIVRRYWGLEAFGQFSLAFRVRSALEWIVLLQLPLALARLMSMAEQPDRRWRFAVVGMLCGAALVGVFGALALLWPGLAASLLFGSETYASWVAPLCALLFSYSIFLLSSGILRGAFAFTAANIMQVMSLAVVPCVALLVMQHLDVRAAVVRSSLVSAAISAAILLLAVQRLLAAGIVRRAGPDRAGARTALQELLSFGTPRLLTVILSGTFTLSLPWLLARDGHVAALAEFNAAMALMAGTALITAPISFVILPILSRNIAQRRTEVATEQLRLLLSATIFMSVLASLAAAGFLGDFMTVLLGERGSTDAVLVVAVAAILPLFLCIDIVRAPIDAASTKPLNAASYLVGGATTVACYFLLSPLLAGSPILVCSLALVCGYAAAGTTALLILRALYGGKLLQVHDRYLLAGWVVVICGCLATTLLGNSAHWVNRWIAAATLIIAGSYALIAKPNWFRFMLQSRAS